MSHRGMTYDLVEKAAVPFPQDDDRRPPVNPLPSRWNSDDRHQGLDVLGDGYEVKHSSSHRSSGGERDYEACAIRADNPMPPQCGVYYFEILILNRKREEYVLKVPSLSGYIY
jgi:hypothetical protein